MKSPVTGKRNVRTDSARLASELEEIQSLMPMSDPDFQALKESIRREGIKDELRGYMKDRMFHVLSGANRLRAAQELKINSIPIEEVSLKGKNARQQFAIDENLSRRHLNTEQKRNLVVYYLQRFPEFSDRFVAEKAGVSPSTVGERRKQLSKLDSSKPGGSTVQIGQLKRKGKDGKARRAPAVKPPGPPVVSPAQQRKELKSQIAALDRQIKTLTDEKRRLENDLKKIK